MTSGEPKNDGISQERRDVFGSHGYIIDVSIRGVAFSGSPMYARVDTGVQDRNIGRISQLLQQMLG
jgi:hypothetical protein